MKIFKSALHLGLILLVPLSVFAWWFSFAQTEKPPCPAEAPRHAPHPITGETCPKLGRMGAVKLAIPQHYLLGPVGYKGVDIWDAESYRGRPKTNSFDNEWDNFAIKIRLTNFKPIETKQDEADYWAIGSKYHPTQKVPVEGRWIHVGFEARSMGLRDVTDIDKINFKNMLHQYWLNDTSKYTHGPFVKKPDQFGLAHYISVQEPVNIPGQPLKTRDQYEIFYDAKTHKTFITCANAIQSETRRVLNHCDHRFLIPEIKALVSVDSFEETADLERWPIIEAEIRKVIQSFIVP